MVSYVKLLLSFGHLRHLFILNIQESQGMRTKFFGRNSLFSVVIMCCKMHKLAQKKEYPRKFQEITHPLKRIHFCLIF